MTIQSIVSPLPPVLTLDADYATNKSLVSTTGPDAICNRASPGYYMNASGVWVQALADVARFHHYYINGQIVSGGLLREPERTNLLTRTEDISHADWGAAGLTPTSVAALAPNGGAAWRLTDSIDGAPTFHRILQAINYVAGTTYCHSIFVKPETLKTISFNNTSVFQAQTYFNLEEETTQILYPDSRAILKRLPNGWYYVAVINEAVTTGTSYCQWWTAAPIPAGGVSTDYQGTGKSLLVWAPQSEVGKSPSTPIVSGVIATTRLADEISISANDFQAIYNNSACLLNIGARSSNLEKDYEYARIDDLTDQNSVTLGRAADGDFYSRVKANNAYQLNTEVTHLYNDLEPILAGVTFKANKAIGGIKGVLTSPSTAVTVPVNPSRLLIGGTNFNGCISSIKLYDSMYRSYTDFQNLLGSYLFVEPDTLGAISANVYTDVQQKTVTAAFAKLSRIHVDASLYHKAGPGARIRIQTTIPDVKFLFEVDDPQPYSYQGVFSVLVNGVESDQYLLPANSTGQFTIEVLGTGSRLIEVIMPMGASVRFKGIQRYGSGTITAPVARPTKTIACFGDSITNGYFASRVTKSWPYLLGVLESAEIINVGYGSETSGVVGLGTEAGNIGAEHTIYCIGYNDFGAQVPLATYKANVQQFVDDFRAVQPTAKLYLGGPFYTPNTNTLTPAMYRTQIADIVTSEADANTILLDTLNAASNNATSWPDTIHPSNAGSLEIATSFSGVIP